MCVCVQKQHPATTTSAPTPSPASTSRTTAPAPGTPTRTSSSSPTAAACASPRAASAPARPPARSSSRARGCCDGGLSWALRIALLCFRHRPALQVVEANRWGGKKGGETTRRSWELERACAHLHGETLTLAFDSQHFLNSGVGVAFIRSFIGLLQTWDAYIRGGSLCIPTAKRRNKTAPHKIKSKHGMASPPN